MMEYKIFKEIVEEQFLNYMPEEYKDYSVRIEEVHKTNQTLDGLCLTAPESKGPAALPTIYINHLYENYLETGNFPKTMESAVKDLITAYRDMPAEVGNFNLSHTNGKIIMALVNTEQNRKMLENIPHRDFHDLSIVYRLMVGTDESGMYSALINDRMAEKIGMTEQELYVAAFINTKELLPPMIRGMEEVIKEIMVLSGIDEEMAVQVLKETAPKKAMYILSNSSEVNGAVSMLYEEELHKFAENIGTDLYILPSSVNEVILVPAEGEDLMELAQMVTDINMREVPVGERLSNQVYHYDRHLRQISLATDTPNKRLDDPVDVLPVYYEPKQIR